MPRDVNGNFTLPAGNPVVSGTPISSSVHNTTNSDIATALTDSLSRTGKGGMLSALPFADGSAANPSVTFTNELTTGIFRNTAGEWNVSILGQKVLTVADDGVYSEKPFWEWNTTLGAYVALLNAGDDYTINGDWNFDKLLTLNGAVEESRGRYLFHDDPAYSSAAIYYSAAAPTPGDGSDGDIWFQLEP